MQRVAYTFFFLIWETTILTVTTVTYIKNVVITLFFWLQFRLQNGYSKRLDCNQFNTNGVRTQKKFPFLSCFNLLGWGTRGKGKRHLRHREGAMKLFSCKSSFLFASVEDRAFNSVATCTYLTKFFINGSKHRFVAFFNRISRSEKTVSD